MIQKLRQIASGIENDSVTPTSVGLNDGRHMFGTVFNLNDYVIAVGEDSSYEIVIITISYSNDSIGRGKSFDSARVRYFGEHEVELFTRNYQRPLQELASTLHRNREQQQVTARNPNQLADSIASFL